MQVPLTVLRSIDADLGTDFGHRRPVEPRDGAAGKPLAEIGLLASFEEQIGLVALLTHVDQRAIEPRRIEALPEQRFSSGVEPDTAAL